MFLFQVFIHLGLLQLSAASFPVYGFQEWHVGKYQFRACCPIKNIFSAEFVLNLTLCREIVHYKGGSWGSAKPLRNFTKKASLRHLTSAVILQQE